MGYWVFMNVLNVLFRHDYETLQKSALNSEHGGFRDSKLTSKEDGHRKRLTLILFPGFQADISVVQLS